MKDQVLVTGISGFIAKHVALDLLRQGYRVRGTLRDAARGGEVRSALAAAGADTDGLSFAEADLTADQGWAEAVAGCAFVQHLASPFPMAQPRDREALVAPAREGALRVLEASRAAGVERIVLTSSMVAMMYQEAFSGEVSIGESDWTDVEWSRLPAYTVSKTRAERAVWDWADRQRWRDRLVVINPGLVLGPALDSRIGTSLGIVELLMKGAYPAVPPSAYPIVDVRDLASLEVRAMTAEGAAGRRLIAAGETLSMSRIGKLLKEFFPDYAKKIPSRVLPAFVVRLVALFDQTLKGTLADLDVVPIADSAYVTELTGVEFRPAADSLRASGRSLIEHAVV